LNETRAEVGPRGLDDRPQVKNLADGGRVGRFFIKRLQKEKFGERPVYQAENVQDSMGKPNNSQY